MCPLNQLSPDSLTLKIPVNSEIGQVCEIRAVSDRTGHTHKSSIAPGCQDDVGIGKHSLNGISIIDRTTFGQRGAHKYVDEFICREFRFDLVIGHVDETRLLRSGKGSYFTGNFTTVIRP